MITDRQLKSIGDNAFLKTFSSIQLLGFTVLYYNFNFSTEKLTQFNKKLHEYNGELSGNFNAFDKAEKEIEKIWNVSLPHKVKEFPYRAKTYIIGGLPKGGMQAINMEVVESNRAIESYIVLSLNALMQMDKKFGKAQFDCFYENLKANSMNYANGMRDEFIMEYFKEQIDINITK